MEIKLYSVKKRNLSYGSARFEKRRFFSKKKSFWPVSHLYSMHWNIGNIQVFTKLLAQREAVKQKWHLSVMSKDFNLGKLEWKRWPKKNFLLSQYASKCSVCLERWVGSIFLWNHISTVSIDIVYLVTNVTSKLT